MLALVAAPLVWLGLRKSETGTEASQTSPSARVPTGARAVLKQGRFWILTAMTGLMALGVEGIVVHLLPMFQDAGADPARAAAIASLLGLASVVGRISIGFMLDRIEPSLVTLAVFILAAAGMLILWGGSLATAPIAVVLLGLAAGAEVDLVSYLTSRLFGSHAYSTIYGWLYSVFAVGFGISPFISGRIRDITGSYDLALLGGASLLALAGILAMRLGPMRPPQASMP